MKNLILALGFLTIATHAEAYSILWGPIYSGNASAWAWAHQGFEFSESDFDVATFPGESAPLVADAALNRLSGWGAARSYASTVAVGATANGIYGSLGAGTGTGIATIERLFKVIGGGGLADVKIDLAVDADNGWGYGDAACEWSAGVVGVSSIGDRYSVGGGSGWWSAFDVHVSPSWAGSLAYGEVYAFQMRASADAAMDGECGTSLRLLDTPIDAQPIPEPATWALLGLGCAVLASQMRGRKRNSRA